MKKKETGFIIAIQNLDKQLQHERESHYNQFLLKLEILWDEISKEQRWPYNVSKNVIPKQLTKILKKTTENHKQSLSTIMVKLTTWIEEKHWAPSLNQKVMAFREEVAKALMYRVSYIVNDDSEEEIVDVTTVDTPENLRIQIEKAKDPLAIFLINLLCVNKETSAFMDHHSHLRKLRSTLRDDIRSQYGEKAITEEGIKQLTSFFGPHEVLKYYNSIRTILNQANTSGYAFKARRGINLGTGFKNTITYWGSGRDKEVDALYQASKQGSLSDVIQQTNDISMDSFLNDINSRLEGIKKRFSKKIFQSEQKRIPSMERQ